MKRRILTPSLKAKLAQEREQKFENEVTVFTQFIVRSEPLMLDEEAFDFVLRRPNWMMGNQFLYGSECDVYFVWQEVRFQATLHGIDAPLVKNLGASARMALRELAAVNELAYLQGFSEGRNNGAMAIPLGVVKLKGATASARTLPLSALHKSTT